MKVFDLRCDSEHAFEGWFGSEGDFESQQARGLLECPFCGSRQIRRLPSAPRLNLGASAAEPKQEAALPTAAQMQALLVKMAREIAANTEDVGERFAEEARRIHYREAPERGIRGVTSRQEAEALEEEGIRVMPLPFAHLLKDPLQ
ncbi:MAG: DUF1178 family protein [Burkholderiaceae bacterium]